MRINPAFLDTPMRRSNALDRLLDAELLFKDETQNPIRSFKGRGACNLLAELSDSRPIVCASAGNFGQGIAWAARDMGIAVTVFAPTGAVGSKVEAMRSLGATVLLDGSDFDDAKELAQKYALLKNLLFVEDGAHAAIAEGAGTLAVEACSPCGELDVVLCPLGNGALMAGVGAWFRHARPEARTIAVSAGGGAARGGGGG